MALGLSGDGEITGFDPTASGFGKVLQVVQGTTTTGATIASTSLTDTGLSATITPTSATSKILILVDQAAVFYRTANKATASVAILRDSTVIYGDDQAYEEQVYAAGATSIEIYTRLTRKYLDSPNTTSATTYKTQARVETTANTGAVGVQGGNVESTMILLEVAA